MGKRGEQRALRDRPEIESKSQIRAAAYHLMWSRGYDEASYTAIADACGLGRPLVQKHFPKKEQLLYELMEDVIVSCIAVLEERGLLGEHAGADLLKATQLFYSVLLRDEETRNLAQYSLKQEGTSVMVATIKARYARMLGLGDDLGQLRDSIVWVMGGMGQVIADKMSRSEMLDANDFAVQTTTALLVINEDARFSEMREALTAELLDTESVGNMAEAVLDRVLGSAGPKNG